jgi:AcrR family transcriptional regulator
MDETRRERLISAAADLLDRGGPAAVTLRGVGRAAGVSHNAPYRHFADKHDLLAAVACRELRRHKDFGADGVLPPAAPRALTMDYVRWALRYPERFKLTFGRWTRANLDLVQAMVGARAPLIDAVGKAQAKGELPGGDPERVAALMQALAHGAADLALAGHLSATGKGRAGPEDLVADLFRHLKSSANAAPRA